MTDVAGPAPVRALRARAAQIVWLVCVGCALVLATGALLVALRAPESQQTVRLVLDAADAVDLWVFDRETGIEAFRSDGAEVGPTVLGWGSAALVWLLGGLLAERVLRP